MHARARQLIEAHQMLPHPEGGYYRRFHESDECVVSNGILRPATTAVKYLMLDGERCLWHRIDAEETWIWREGGPIELSVFDAIEGRLDVSYLDDPAGGGTPSRVVPAGSWQRAHCLGSHALVDCQVAPGFAWEGFELLPAGGEIEQRLRDAGARLE